MHPSCYTIDTTLLYSCVYVAAVYIAGTATASSIPAHVSRTSKPTFWHNQLKTMFPPHCRSLAHPEALAGVLADLEARRIVAPFAFAVVQNVTGSADTDPNRLMWNTGQMLAKPLGRAVLGTRSRLHGGENKSTWLSQDELSLRHVCFACAPPHPKKFDCTVPAN